MIAGTDHHPIPQAEAEKALSAIWGFIEADVFVMDVSGFSDLGELYTRAALVVRRAGDAAGWPHAWDTPESAAVRNALRDKVDQRPSVAMAYAAQGKNRFGVPFGSPCMPGLVM